MKKENIPRENAIEPREITDELREAYLDYAMSVIVSRALPDVRDGLKPVQRRILWAMWDISLSHDAKPKKSANVVGEVLGKYHPHGDAPVYDALARMAQDFSLRYPLIDGQGNWGSIDGDPPAAMRYTEARLSKIASELLTDIERETVEWRPNYDNSREEPLYLPAKLPHLIVNGAVGIAVGMATSIPPHNLGEIAHALIHLAAHPNATVDDLMEFVPGPDFPTGGIIHDKRSILEAYSTGKGSIAMRAVAEIEERKSGSFQIVVTEIPYQVNKSDLLLKIAELVQNKKIEGVRDVRDESDREGLRIVIELKQDSAPQKILNQLYQYTELQKNFHVNMLALENGIQPEVLSLKELLGAVLEHRKDIIRRRATFDLAQAKARAHILEGLVTALDAIDKVIETIKKSNDKDDARANLMKKFKLTEIQANAILEMRLQALAALEQKKIEEELKEKRALIKELELILKEPKRITAIIVKDLEELKEQFPEKRRTRIATSALKEFSEEDLIPHEETIVTLTEDGYIKRMAPTSFRAQKRGGKGLIGFELRDEDQIHQIVSADSHDNILFFTDRGKVFQTKVYEIPAASRTAKGKALHNFLEIPTTERVTAIVTYREKDKGYLFMATTNGTVKKTSLADFSNVRRSGIIAITLKEDVLRWVRLTSGVDDVILATTKGQAIRFNEKDVRSTGRSASGVRAMRLSKGDAIAGLAIMNKEKGAASRGPRLLVVTSHGFAKQTPVKDYKVQRRGGGGIKTANITEKTGSIIGAHMVFEDMEEVIAFSSKGQALRTPLSAIRVAGRATQGVRIMNLEKGDSLIGIVCL